MYVIRLWSGNLMDMVEMERNKVVLALWHIFGTMTQVLSLMATHSDDRSQFRLTEWRKKGICRFPIDQAACTHGFVDQKARIAYTRTFTEGKARTCWKTKFWSVVFGPLYFDPWYCSKVFGPKCWTHVFGPRYWS